MSAESVSWLWGGLGPPLSQQEWKEELKNLTTLLHRTEGPGGPGTEEPGGLPSMGSHRVGHD